MKKKNMRQYILSAAVALALALIVPVTNLLVDPAGLFRSDSAGSPEARAVEIMFSGKSAEGLINYDERLVKRLCIDRIDGGGTLALGSSRAAMITAEMAGESDFFNLAVTAAALRDIIGVYGVYYARHGHAERVIISIDPWFLNSGYDSGRFENVLSDGYCAYLEQVMGFSASNTGYSPFVGAVYSGKSSPLAFFSYPRAIQAELFSIPYFQSGLSLLLNNEAAPAITPSGDYWTAGGSLRPDGSYCYPKVYRDAPIERIAELAQSQTIPTAPDRARVTGSEDMRADDPNRDLFFRFLKSLCDAGVKVDLVITPLNPVLYDFMREHERYEPVLQSCQWYEETAASLGLGLAGDFNPHKLNARTDDFYDGYHYKPQGVEILMKEISWGAK